MLVKKKKIKKKFTNFVFNFSSKHLKSLTKTDSSPFFLDTDGKNPIFRFIYDLLNDGIRGTTRKDAVLAILADLAVSVCLKPNFEYFSNLD